MNINRHLKVFIANLADNIVSVVAEINPFLFLYRIFAGFVLFSMLIVLMILISVIMFRYQAYILLSNGAIFLYNIWLTILNGFSGGF